MSRSIKRRRRLKIFAILGLILVALAATSLFFPQDMLTVDSGPVTADALVVLGGGNHERPERAAELFKAGTAPLIICTGHGDALANEFCLTNHGVPMADIILEPDSKSTKENAKFTIALLRARHIKSAIIVTTWYHSRRALACFEHYGPDLKFYTRPSYFGYPKFEWNRLSISGYIKMEYLKILGYWICYGVCPL